MEPEELSPVGCIIVTRGHICGNPEEALGSQWGASEGCPEKENLEMETRRTSWS